MPILTVEHVGSFTVPDGKRLVLALEEDCGIDQLHACGGHTRCTTCRVVFLAGEPATHTKAEIAALDKRQLTGVRLSCQILCDHDMTVRAISRLAGSGRADAGPKPQPFIEPPPEYKHRGTPVAVLIDSAVLIRAYRQGIFPMALDGGEIGWFSPDPRGILPLDTFHASARLARVVRQGKFQVHIDRAFEAVMRACAARSDDEGTWISDVILESYVTLHRLGLAHSVETWRDDVLVGGLYGVHLGAAFFGESMFHRETDASKVALVALVDRLNRRGFELLDIQWVTPHLAQFGAVEIPRAAYQRRLAHALARVCVFVD